MPKALDLTGKRFGRLIAISKAESRNSKTYWLCKCDCGVEKEIQTGNLTSGATRSCGCLEKEINKRHPVVEIRKRVKIALVEAFGHKCCCCGLIDDPVLYDFHHLNPENKKFSLSNPNTRSKVAYAEEAKKCIMVCSNCHRKIENKLINLDDYELISLDEEIYYETLNQL